MDKSINKLFEEPRLLKPSEVAHILNISKSKVYKMIEENEFPVVRMGKVIRITYSTLIDLIYGNE